MKKDADIAPLLRRLRIAAIPSRGYISGETLIDTDDGSVITVGTWRSLEDWKGWETSRERSELNRQIEPLLANESTIRVCRILSIEELDYLEDPTGWLAAREHSSMDGC